MAMKHGGRGPGHLSRWTAATSPIPYLFASGSQGAWFDFTDTSTWYQDAARTTPAATLGDVVGLVLDKSRGLALGPELVTNGDFASGTTGWTDISGSWAVTGGALAGTAIAANAYGPYSDAVVGGVGVTYCATFTLTISSGGTRIRVGNDQSTEYTSSGTYTRCFQVVTGGATAFQLRAGASGFTGSIDNISVKLLAGNHASQATTAQKPIRARIPLGGRRNMRTYTEDLTKDDNTKSDCTAPSAGRLLATVGGSYHYIYYGGGLGSQTGSWTSSFEVKKDNNTWIFFSVTNSSLGYFNLDTGLFGTNPDGATATLLADGYYRITVSKTLAAQTPHGGVGVANANNGASFSAAGTEALFIRNMQLELGAAATAYQKVVAAWDVTESGVTSIPALYYDGSDDSLATAAIDFATCTSDGAARRNLLTFPTAFNDTAWTGATSLTITANSLTAPDGSTTADTGTRSTTAAAENNRRQTTTQANSTAYTYSCYVKAGNAGAKLYLRNLAIDAGVSNGVVQFDPNDGTISLTYGSTYAGNATMTAVGSGWYRCVITGTTLGPIVNNLVDVGVTDGGTAVGGTSGSYVYIWGAQLELGSTATAFQDIGTDKMTVFAGVEKLSDAAAGTVVELTASSSSNVGSFALFAPSSAASNYGFRSEGNPTVGTMAAATGYTAPNCSVVTGQGGISTDQCILRVNGAQVASDTQNQGTGNYSNAALYLGRRNSASVPFKGYMIGHLVLVGKLANASEIAAVEATERAATGAY